MLYKPLNHVLMFHTFHKKKSKNKHSGSSLIKIYTSQIIHLRFMDHCDILAVFFLIHLIYKSNPQFVYLSFGI